VDLNIELCDDVVQFLDHWMLFCRSLLRITECSGLLSLDRTHCTNSRHSDIQEPLHRNLPLADEFGVLIGVRKWPPLGTKYLNWDSAVICQNAHDLSAQPIAESVLIYCCLYRQEVHSPHTAYRCFARTKISKYQSHTG
jgi:hypothetical protein